ncbi:hypothetical protein Ciccas_001028 [Cichlidogyrus casuarinus]|uniref:Uncharacterized protein n=1 Tax=Cichlidogyrus casuarinus TaxID=1844966 RepID=A0ABD2QLP3_9PLAT
MLKNWRSHLCYVELLPCSVADRIIYRRMATEMTTTATVVMTLANRWFSIKFAYSSSSLVRQQVQQSKSTKRELSL